MVIDSRVPVSLHSRTWPGRLWLAFGLVPVMLAGGGTAQAKDKPKASAPLVGVCPSPCPSPTPTPTPRPPDASGSLEVKYVRDSEEYATLTRMVYGLAAQAVERAVAEREREHDSRLLAVVLDIDETALDNSVYQLERAAYGVPFADDSWNAWVRRRAAGVVPGVAEFLREARGLGVRVAWISNRDRDDDIEAATRANLAAWGLWDNADRLCLQSSDANRKKLDPSKAERRRQLRAGGDGRCSFGTPARVVAYVGDQLGDFPRDDEPGAEAVRASDFGCRYFLLPDPMYGGWTNKVTRPLP